MIMIIQNFITVAQSSFHKILSIFCHSTSPNTVQKATYCAMLHYNYYSSQPPVIGCTEYKLTCLNFENGGKNTRPQAYLVFILFFSLRPRNGLLQIQMRVPFIVWNEDQRKPGSGRRLSKMVVRGVPSISPQCACTIAVDPVCFLSLPFVPIRVVYYQSVLTRNNAHHFPIYSSYISTAALHLLRSDPHSHQQSAQRQKMIFTISTCFRTLLIVVQVSTPTRFYFILEIRTYFRKSYQLLAGSNIKSRMNTGKSKTTMMLRS